MITDERIERLVACDREALIELMAAAYCSRPAADAWVDLKYQGTAFRALMDAARQRVAERPTGTRGALFTRTSEGWQMNDRDTTGDTP